MATVAAELRDCAARLQVAAMELRDFAWDDGAGHLQFHFHASLTAEDRMRKYRYGLDELRNLVAGLVE